MTTATIQQQVPDTSVASLLFVKDLKVYFEARRGILGPKRHVKAVDGISFEIPKGETLALVGESGCGKTTTARSIVRLVDPTSGSIIFDGVDIAKLRRKDLKNYRKRVQFVFQDPYESLNPRQRIVEILATPIKIHHLANSRSDLLRQVNKLLSDVNLDPSLTRDKYPYQLSGGQRQRVNIARALATNPDLIIADEPVSMLDVSLRLGILALIEKLRKERGLTFLFITHDMAAARQVTERIAVMYLGRIVEIGEADSVIGNPIHPYSKLLVESTPTMEGSESIEQKFGAEGSSKSNLDAISSALQLPSGCRFNPRCNYAIDKCRKIEPPLIERRAEQLAACDVVPV